MKCPADYTTTATDVEIPVNNTATDVAFCPKPTYRRHISIGIYSFTLTPTGCLLDTDTSFNFISANHVDKKRASFTSHTTLPPLRTETKELIQLHRTVRSQLRIGDLASEIRPGFVSNLAISLLHGTSLKDRFICGFFLSEPKMVPWHLNPTVMLASLYKWGFRINSPLVSDDRTKSTNTTDKHLMRVAQQVWMSSVTAKATTVTALAAALMRFAPQHLPAERHFTVAACKIMKVFPN